jgi:nucleoside-diphosphate-sugar epimerase
LPVSDDGGRLLAWINLADAADAVLAAIERGRPGAAYNIVDESRLGFAGMVRAVAEATGAPAPFAVPRWLTDALPFVRLLTNVNMRVSSEKARRELGWKPTYPTVAEGLRATAPHEG